MSGTPREQRASGRLERLWLSVIDSERFRRFAKRGPGAVLFRSQAYGALRMARRYAVTRARSRREPHLFDPVEVFCAFVGHVKSGGTLLGSLLDAHPNALIADEALALQYIARGFSREQLYHLLAKASRRAAMKGRVTARRLGGYAFEVPGQWQGRYTELRVVGDSTAGATTRLLARRPDLLERTPARLGHPLRLVHVVRNPYDPIGVMMVRGARSAQEAADEYFKLCAMLVGIQERARGVGVPVHGVRYEDMVREPEAQLAAVCEFLGLPASGEYLAACAALMQAEPERFRDRIDWPAGSVEAIAARMEPFSFLDGYRFDR